jgi:hypothetical protein
MSKLGGYLSRGEIADRYGMSEEWVCAQTISGALAHINLGNRVLVLPEDFEAFVKTLRTPARSNPTEVA